MKDKFEICSGCLEVSNLNVFIIDFSRISDNNCSQACTELGPALPQLVLIIIEAQKEATIHPLVWQMCVPAPSNNHLFHLFMSYFLPSTFFFINVN